MDKLKLIFNKTHGIIIGALHLPPLAGYPDFPGYDIAGKNAISDLTAFENGGADSVIFENNYDIPHKESLAPEAAECMLELGKSITNNTTLPIGISVLWNDYKTALTIAKKLDLKFIRIPVFVDTVKTSYGIMNPCAKDAINFRKNIGADGVAIFTDIHVKHSEIISKYTIEESARLAIEAGSDGLIITGKWTGDAPDMEQLASIRNAVGEFPIILGSGVDEKNIKNLFKYANAAIVSTSLKEGQASSAMVNLKGYSERISLSKVRALKESL